MDLALAIETLRREGSRMAEAAAAGGLDAAVPTCPGWQLRDLVAHTSGVHRWATTYVREARTAPIDADEEAAIMRPPGDADLLAWFGDGHCALVDALAAAPADLQCWSFLPAPSPLAFWARRQAHETGIHRADAESVRGPITPFTPAVAADGIDELLRAFLVRPKTRLRTDPPRRLMVAAADTGDRWRVTIGPDPVRTERRAGPVGSGTDADCWLRGTASDLLLLVWNRSPGTGVEIGGDRSLLDLWARAAQVRWS